MAVGIDSVSTAIFESLFYLYMAIAVIVGALVLGWLFYIMVKFRARPGEARPRDAPKAGVLPAERGHPIWSYVMAIVIAAIMFGLAFGTISAVHTLETPPEGREAIHANVTGFQFGWRFTFAGQGGIPISEINEWSTPVDTPIVANVTSQDVWHNFALPMFRIRIDAIPGEVTHIWWEAKETGTIEPVCVQICGAGHALMKSTMHILPKDEFALYVADESARAFAALERAGQVVNVTYEAGSFAPEARELAANKPFGVRVVNQAEAEQTFATAHGTITLSPGESGLLYATPGAGATVEAIGTGATYTFGSVS